MLARIFSRTLPNALGVALLACVAVVLTSCATKSPAPLIADPNAVNRETSMPWNEQQKWEREGDAAMMNQNRR
jgi:outer membrane biogenesis lipoprotein LolB